MNVAFFSMKVITDVYVHHHRDRLGGGSLFWLVTLIHMYEPIRNKLSYRTDVIVKAKRTVTWTLNSTTAKGLKIWLDTSVVLVKAHGSVVVDSALSLILHSNLSYVLKTSTKPP